MATEEVHGRAGGKLGGRPSQNGKAAPRRRVGRPAGTDAAVTRQQLLEAGRRLFAENGYHATTTKDIGTAAGVTTGSVYYYFGSKDALYAEVYEQVRTMMFDRLGAQLHAGTSFADALGSLCDEAVRLHREDPSVTPFYVAVPSEARQNVELLPVATRQLAASRSFFTELVKRGLSTGELDPKTDVKGLVDALAAIFNGLARFSISLGPDEHEHAMRALRHALLNGLLHQPTAKRPTKAPPAASRNTKVATPRPAVTKRSATGR